MWRIKGSGVYLTQIYASNPNKVGCVFPMITCPKFRMWQHTYDDQQEDASHFSSQDIRSTWSNDLDGSQTDALSSYSIGWERPLAPVW